MKASKRTKSNQALDAQSIASSNLHARDSTLNGSHLLNAKAGDKKKAGGSLST